MAGFVHVYKEVSSTLLSCIQALLFSHPGKIIRDWITIRSFPYTPQLHVDCASVNQLHDRTLLIDKTHRGKIIASLRHMSLVLHIVNKCDGIVTSKHHE
jgi:hypothetical protein